MVNLKNRGEVLKFYRKLTVKEQKSFNNDEEKFMYSFNLGKKDVEIKNLTKQLKILKSSNLNLRFKIEDLKERLKEC